MNYKSIKHSFLVILIATTTIGCAGNSVQPPASQYQASNSTLNGELIGSRYDQGNLVDDLIVPVATVAAVSVAIPVLAILMVGELVMCGVVVLPSKAVYSIFTDEVMSPGCFLSTTRHKKMRSD